MATSQFINDFKSWFTTPLVIVTASFFAAILYLQLSPVKTGVMFFMLFAVLLVLPVIICSVRGAHLGYQFGETKKSIKDDIFRRLAFKSNRILFMTLIISQWSQSIADHLFKWNHYLAMFVVLLVAFLLVWPHIRQYLRYRNAIGRDEIKRIPIIPLKEGLFLGWLWFVLIAVDLITKFIAKPQPATVHYPLSLSAAVIIYGIVTVIMILMMINVLVTIKLYRSEFKTTMISN